MEASLSSPSDSWFCPEDVSLLLSPESKSDEMLDNLFSVGSRPSGQSDGSSPSLRSGGWVMSAVVG